MLILYSLKQIQSIKLDNFSQILYIYIVKPNHERKQNLRSWFEKGVSDLKLFRNFQTDGSLQAAFSHNLVRIFAKNEFIRSQTHHNFKVLGKTLKKPAIILASLSLLQCRTPHPLENTSGSTLYSAKTNQTVAMLH